MKRFQFEQQQLLVLRRRQRDAAESQVSAATNALAQRQQQLHDCDMSLASLSEQIDSSPNQLGALSSVSSLLRLRQSIESQAAALQRKQHEALERLRQANVNVETLQLLRDQQHAEHIRTERQKEEHEHGFRSLIAWKQNQSNVAKPLNSQSNLT